MKIDAYFQQCIDYVDIAWRSSANRHQKRVAGWVGKTSYFRAKRYEMHTKLLLMTNRKLYYAILIDPELL